MFTGFLIFCSAPLSYKVYITYIAKTDSIDEDSKDIIKELIQHGIIKEEPPVLHSHAFRNGTSSSYSEKY